MEATSRQKDKVGIHRYGIFGDDMEALIEIGEVSKPNYRNGCAVVLLNSYAFQTNDHGKTWTGPHLGKPDLDAKLKRYSIVPEKVKPIKK